MTNIELTHICGGGIAFTNQTIISHNKSQKLDNI